MIGFRVRANTMSLHSLKEDNWPPLAVEYNEKKKQFFAVDAPDDYFRYITAVGSL